MKLRPPLVLQLAALCLALGASAFAANDGYLYIVHGIPGRDISATSNPGLPVDILVSGECLSRGLAFGSTAGPYTLAPGTYDVEISPANSLAPCTNATMVESSVTLTSGASVSAIAAISGGKPAVLQLNDNLAAVSAGNARFVIANSADAPAVQATLTQLKVKNPKTYTVTANPGAQSAITVPAGTYAVEVSAAGSTVMTLEVITLANQSAMFTYAVGQASNNSVGLINRAIRDVF